MTDRFIRHFVSVVGVLIGLLIYYVGYSAGTRGWWATALTMVIIYPIVYKIVHV